MMSMKITNRTSDAGRLPGIEAESTEGSVRKGRVSPGGREAVGSSMDEDLSLIPGRGNGGVEGLPAPELVLGSSREAAGLAREFARQLRDMDLTQITVDFQAIMASILKASQETRNAQRAVRDAELDRQQASLQGAAKQIREAAEEAFQGELVAGILQASTGGVKIAAGVGSSVLGFRAIRLNQEAGVATAQAGAVAGGRAVQLGGQAASLTAQAGRLETWSGSSRTVAEVSGDWLGATSGLSKSARDRQAALENEKRAELEAQAKVHEEFSQQAKDQMQRMMEVIRDVLERFGAIDQANAENNRSIARNI